ERAATGLLDVRRRGWPADLSRARPLRGGRRAGVIDHALRFTVSTTQRAFVHPATHYASNNTDPNVPPMGLRFRMKSSYNCGSFSAEVQVICAALKRYGMFVADNGSDWYITGAPDPRWSDDRLGDPKAIPGAAYYWYRTRIARAAPAAER